MFQKFKLLAVDEVCDGVGSRSCSYLCVGGCGVLWAEDLGVVCGFYPEHLSEGAVVEGAAR